MKKNYLFFFFIISLFVSCEFQKSIEGDDYFVERKIKFINNSTYVVSVYENSLQESNNFLLEIPSNSIKEIAWKKENTKFYFAYNVDFGIENFSYQYYVKNTEENESFNEKANEYIIDEIYIKDLSFLVLKNNLPFEFCLKSIPNDLCDHLCDNNGIVEIGEKVVYLISDEKSVQDQAIPPSLLSNDKLKIDGKEPFPLPKLDYKLGFIYHITCTDEGAKLTSINHLDKTEHELTYKNEVDYHLSICNICGFKTEKETHLFQNKNDDVSHWQECDCGYKTESTEHLFQNKNDNVSHWQECFCGYKTEEHLFTIQNDEKCHWQECDCGYTGNESEHALSGWQKRDGKDVKRCTECEFEIIAEANTHIIYSVSDLNNMRYNNTPSAIFELACDIDGGELTWIPIDTFYGTLVGNGYSIKNFNINHISALDNHTTYCGFFYKNKGGIKNIFFKNITVNATFEYQTSDWRYVNVGTVAAANYGEIHNVHLEDVTIKSNLNHKSAESFNDVKFINIVGGIVGKNYESINYCSIRQSSISGSTDSKKNWCDSSTWVGGLCGENTKDCTNLLSIKTKVSATTKGGYNWLIGNDGHLKCYAGCIFGFIKGNGTNSKIVSYNNSKPQISLVDCNKDNDDGYCDNIEKIEKSDYIYGGNEQNAPDAYHSNDLDSISSLIDSWPNWSVTDTDIENYVE